MSTAVAWPVRHRAGGLTIGPAGSGANYIVDGVNDHIQINTAIAAAALAGGGQVRLAAFTYDIAGVVRLMDGVTLVGEGAATVLRAAAGLNADGVVVNDDQVNGNDDIGLRDLTIDGNRAAQTQGSGFFANTVDPARNGRVRVHGVRFHNCWEHDCHPKRCDDLQISDCLFDGSGSSTFDHGTYLLDCDDATITGCISFGHAGNGFNAKQGGRVTHTGCIAFANAGRGIRVADYDHANTTGCIAESNGDVGILYTLEIAQGVVRGTITGNTTRANGAQGIWVVDSTGITIAANTCPENTLHGIAVRNTVRFTVTGNVCEGNGTGGHSGIYIEGTCSHFTITGNDCRKTTRAQKFGLELVDTVDFFLVTANNFTENFTGTINKTTTGTNGLVINNWPAENPDPTAAAQLATKNYVDTTAYHAGYAGELAPVELPATTTSALAAQDMLLTRWVPRKSRTITALGFAVSTAAGANDAVFVAIYDAGLNLLGSSLSTAGKLNALGAKSVALQAGVAVTKNTVYYVALLCPALGGTAASVVVAQASTLASAAGQLFGATAPNANFLHKTGQATPPLTVAAPTVGSVGPYMAAQE